MAADILIVRISSYAKKYYQYWTHIYGIADMIILMFNCKKKTWIFFKNSDPSEYDWHYEKSQRYERFYENISVGHYNFTISYASTENGSKALSYCHDGVDYITENGDGHLYKSGTICLGWNIDGNSSVHGDGQDLEWVIHRSRYWAVAFAYWCEYGNWMDP